MEMFGASIQANAVTRGQQHRRLAPFGAAEPKHILTDYAVDTRRGMTQSRACVGRLVGFQIWQDKRPEDRAGRCCEAPKA
jgi:hypothetical protein